ncbi:MAG: hypothetical protein HY692_07135, partial [Cyanobacteria bacterium NC_groundwater_1444_Ag_S-0.65um_54_12]|nr:hypothetical protein [Cyanobacteria bacterium NC_groundwater_1444_Ag_S-0.65um_54_12]
VVATASADLVKQGIHSGKLVGAFLALLGGRGGGRAELAQGGGGEATRLAAAIAQAPQLVQQQLTVRA